MAVMVGAWFSLVAVFFTTKAIRAAYSRAGRWINRTTGAVFIAFGVRLALQKAAP
ncbi:LysE family transporter [Flaviflagellibacter deserti]|uniref:LysE family transporter n=1 Tax=Flaviflagellibacter deserti TaxID=2267266 RepID=A0ABV9Z4I7_9HYPH